MCVVCVCILRAVPSGHPPTLLKTGKKRYKGKCIKITPEKGGKPLKSKRKKKNKPKEMNLAYASKVYPFYPMNKDTECEGTNR